MKTIYFLIFLVLGCLHLSAHAFQERKLYVGSDSTEAVMTFAHCVEMESAIKPTVKQAKEQIDVQVSHLFGPLGASEYPAVPRGNHKITNITFEKKDASSYLVKYSYEGTIVVKNGPKQILEISLPTNPDTIFDQGRSGSKNPCTDDHYQEREYFWYFWNPKNTGCKLAVKKDYNIVRAKIKRTLNTNTSYPEYERLADGNGLISITLLMGMDDSSKDWNPNNSTDTNADNFRPIKKALLARNYVSKVWTQEEIEKFSGRRLSKVPYVEELVKKLGKYTLSIRMFFGPSAGEYGSDGFHSFFKDALERSSVMIYDGHSGLGEYLDLPNIERKNGFNINLPKDKYQIYFFNSCSSYSYYNTMFFDRKVTDADLVGTKNLDILTNGLSTFFYVMHDTNMALIKAIETFAAGKGRISYQAIAKEIDSGNLFGVNGDEDNSN